MAKKSQRRSARYERDQLGCMWGFISMFNFRPGRSGQKLLVDLRHGSKRSTGTGSLRNKLDKSTYSNEKAQDTLDVKERNVAIDVGKPSVKKLIEEELFIDQEAKRETINGELGQLSDSELEGHRKKNQRRKNRTRRNSCGSISLVNAADNAGSEVRGNLKHQTADSLDIDDMIEEFCCDIHQRNTSRVKHDQLNQKNEDYKEKLSQLIKFLISQKLVRGNRPMEDSGLLTSKDLMEVFQILGSNEELFLKLLQDPDLLVSKDFEELQNGLRVKEENAILVEGENQNPVEGSNSSEQSDVLVNRKQCSFFRRKNKPQERTTNDEPQTSDRIVILKPGPASSMSPKAGDICGSSPESHSSRNERVSSHFFLAEIKRKLKHAIGKERRGVPGEGGIKEGFRKSVQTKEHFFMERMARPSTGEKKGEKTGLQLKEFGTGIEHESGNRKQMLSHIYIEAKKHLSEMLSNGDMNDPDLSSKQVPRTLGRILSLPQYLSPLPGPVGKSEQGSSTAHKRSASEGFQSVDENKKENNATPPGQITQNLEGEPCISDNGSDTTVELLHSVTSELGDGSDNKVDDTSNEITTEANQDTAKGIEITEQEESEASDASSEQCSSSMSRSDQNHCDVSQIKDDKIDVEVLKQDSFGETQPLSSSLQSPSYSSINGEECQADAPDLPEWSSPISVLEPLFTEEDVSPASVRSHCVETQMQPLRIQFEEKNISAADEGNQLKTSADDKELVFKYVKAVLNALHLNWEELHLKSLSSDQLLEPSLMTNVKFLPNQLCPDQELLFDCINEVLFEHCGHEFGCSPWVSFIKPKIQPISDMENIIPEVQEGVYWHLLPSPLPRTLDQIVRKDMAKTGKWMDLLFDVDCIGVETGEVILDELLEEIISGFE